MQLHNLPSLVKKRKRVGRGGKLGGTAGRGGKGQKARTSGPIRPGFEGGQMPLYRRLPKRGFNNAQFTLEYKIVNLKHIENAFQEGQEVTKETLLQKGLVRAPKGAKGATGFLVKVLGDGNLSKKLVILADAFSKSALQAIQSSGGEARIINNLA